VQESNKDYFIRLKNDVNSEYEKFTVYPPHENIFKAFKLTPLTDIKVVILGQDPYHSFNQATGLAFSVPKGEKLPPSLRNIYKEIESDLGIKRVCGCLQDIATQGVFFLNASLTVREAAPASHSALGWQTFTDNVIKHINSKSTPVIFLLWGNFAKAKQTLITNPQHKILTSAHPSPLSQTKFFNNKHFSQTNTHLKQSGLQPIYWGRERV